MRKSSGRQKVKQVEKQAKQVRVDGTSRREQAGVRGSQAVDRWCVGSRRRGREAESTEGQGSFPGRGARGVSGPPRTPAHQMTSPSPRAVWVRQYLLKTNSGKVE